MQTPQNASRHRKRDSDPLADLPDHVVELNDVGAADTGSESLLARLVLGPLTMISFLLSLGVVDTRQRAWRVAQHQHDSPTWWAKFSPWVWWNAQPYQSEDLKWQHANDIATLSHGTDGNAPVSAVGTSHIRKKHRKMARLALTDALEMRGMMTFTLVATALLGLIAIIWLARRLHVSTL